MNAICPYIITNVVFLKEQLREKYYLFKIKQEKSNTAECKICIKFSNEIRFFKELFPLGLGLLGYKKTEKQGTIVPHLPRDSTPQRQIIKKTIKVRKECSEPPYPGEVTSWEKWKVYGNIPIASSLYSLFYENNLM